MSCANLVNIDNTLACFFCDTTDVAFGPVIYGTSLVGAVERLELFRLWLNADPRSIPVDELMNKFSEWLNINDRTKRNQTVPSVGLRP